MEGEKNQYLQQEEEVKSRGMFDFMKKKKEEKEEEKKEECEEDKVVAGMENVHVTEVEKLEEKKIKEEEKNEEKNEEKKESLFAKLHRSDSSSSSSSDEEEIGPDGEKRKKKKGLKEKIKGKFGGDHKNEEEIKTSTMVIDQEVVVPTPPSTYSSPPATYTSPPAIHTSPPPSYAPPPPPAKYEDDDTSIKVEKVDEVIKGEVSPHEEEKKGFLEKIKDKLPGQKKEETTVVCEEASSPDGKEKKGILGKIMDKIPGYNKAPAGEETKGSEGH
ncbi:hypothetical protein LUZ60_016732 [Juncus effusus]|nr:hypothetical protein LUZ60_016732 [Juncus effusus]